jgi:hypothetical protein
MLIQQFSGSAAVISYASTIFRKAGFSVAIGTTMLGIFVVSIYKCFSQILFDYMDAKFKK